MRDRSKAPPVQPSRGRLKRTKLTYETVLQAYRESPNNHDRARRQTGYDREAVRRLWEVGWPKLPWARPIKLVLGEETKAAQAAALERVRVERELSDADRVKKVAAYKAAVEEETSMMAAVRQDVLSAALVARRLVPAMTAVSSIITNAVLDADGKAKVSPTLTPMQALKVLKDYTTIVSKIAYAEGEVVKLGRLDRGQATTIVADADLPAEDVLDEIAAVATLHDRLASAHHDHDVGEGEDDPPVH
jgi:hypothetical protein